LNFTVSLYLLCCRLVLLFCMIMFILLVRSPRVQLLM